MSYTYDSGRVSKKDHDCETNKICIPGDYCRLEHEKATRGATFTHRQNLTRVPDDAVWSDQFGWISAE